MGAEVLRTRQAAGAPARRRRGRVRLRLAAPAAALATFVVLTGLVELWVRYSHVKAYEFAPPSAVLTELWRDPGLYLHAALTTLSEAALGLALAAALALAFAAAALHSRLLDRLLTPLVVASQTIPVIAVAPLLALWLGYTMLPRVLVCALIAFFPMAITTLQGLRATDPQLLLLLRSVNATRRDVFWRVRMPGAAPYLAAALRTGVTLSLVGAVVAEWSGAQSGLGYLVLSSLSSMATAQAFAAILVITALGLAAYVAVVLAERRLCWWVRPTGDPSRQRGRP